MPSDSTCGSITSKAHQVLAENDANHRQSACYCTMLDDVTDDVNLNAMRLLIPS
jgi:hypothetical protein